MTNDPHDTVKVAADKLVVIEVYHGALKEAGIESRITGPVLDPGLLMAPLDVMELWVHRSDLEAAEAAIRRVERDKAHHTGERQHHPHPTDEGTPRKSGHGAHTHYNPDPRP